MDKPSFVVIEHIFAIPLPLLRSISFKSGAHAFDTRLRKKSYVYLMSRFDLDGETFTDTSVVKAQETNIDSRIPRVTFSDSWRGTANHAQPGNRETARQTLDQRSHTAPPPRTATLPYVSTTRLTSAPPRISQYLYDSAVAGSPRILQAPETHVSIRTQPLLEPRSWLQTQPNRLYDASPARPTRSHYGTIHSMPSVERYNRSYWDARTENLMGVDLERGGGNTEGRTQRGGCNTVLFCNIVIVFCVTGGLFWWYGKG